MSAVCVYNKRYWHIELEVELYYFHKPLRFITVLVCSYEAPSYLPALLFFSRFSGIF